MRSLTITQLACRFTYIQCMSQKAVFERCIGGVASRCLVDLVRTGVGLKSPCQKATEVP